LIAIARAVLMDRWRENGISTDAPNVQSLRRFSDRVTDSPANRIPEVQMFPPACADGQGCGQMPPFAGELAQRILSVFAVDIQDE
jgi:hypothetical protein